MSATLPASNPVNAYVVDEIRALASVLADDHLGDTDYDDEPTRQAVVNSLYRIANNVEFFNV